MYIKESEVVDVINSLRSNEGSRLEGFMDEFLKKIIIIKKGNTIKIDIIEIFHSFMNGVINASLASFLVQKIKKC